MDDMMLELTAGNQVLRRRLDAYADARLAPHPAAAARMRARVMAAAHRQAALTFAGAGLTVLTNEAPPARRSVSRHPVTRVAGVLLSAALGLSVAVGTTLAAEAGGVLYPVRLGVETLLLPGDPAARAIGEISRLDTRLQEAQAASQRGDMAAVQAAMEAYASILLTASRDAIAAADPVARAALEAGLSRNVEVLWAILERAPESAVDGLTRAIERSGDAIEDINGAGTGGGDGGQHGGGNPGAGPGGPAATDEPTTVDPTREPRPTREPTPDPTPKRTPKPEQTPDRTPPGQGLPSDAGPPDGVPGSGD